MLYMDNIFRLFSSFHLTHKLCGENAGFLLINLPVHIGLLTSRLKVVH